VQTLTVCTQGAAGGWGGANLWLTWVADRSRRMRRSSVWHLSTTLIALLKFLHHLLQAVAESVAKAPLGRGGS
jgi:hypothetical protein